MQDFLARFRVGTWVVHGLMAIVLLILFARTRAMAGWCVFPGLLIACASVAALPGRPISLYAAFGALLGVSFWSSVSAINQGFYLALIPTLLVVVGVAWLLNDAKWPSAIFTGVAVALELLLVASLYVNRDDIRDVELDQILKSLGTQATMLIVGLVYAAVGFAEVLILRKLKKKKKAKAVRVPSGPPLI